MYKTKYLSQNQSIESTEGFEFIFGKKDIDLESFIFFDHNTFIDRI